MDKDVMRCLITLTLALQLHFLWHDKGRVLAVCWLLAAGVSSYMFLVG